MAQPPHTRTPAPAPTEQERLIAETVPVAVRLIEAVREEGPDAVLSVLLSAPDHRLDVLAIVLAAMVDDTARPADLLAWTEKLLPPAALPPRRARRTEGEEYDRLVRANIAPAAARALAAAYANGPSRDTRRAQIVAAGRTGPATSGRGMPVIRSA